MKFGVKTIVAIGIGTALFFLLARFVSIPVFANTYLTLQYGVLGFFAAVYGPIAGLLIGLLGHALTDLTFGFGLWWSWIIVSGLVGLAYGFLMKGVNIEGGEFGVKGALRYILGTVVIQAVAWIGIAPLLDFLIYQEPWSKIILQGAISGGLNALTAAIVGTLLLFAYSKTRTKSGSLNIE